MKKITLFLITLMLATQLPVRAQFMFGPQAGLSVATLTNTADFNVTAKPEWHAGFMFDIGLGKHFSFMPAILYSKRGYKYDYSTTYTTVQSSDTTLTTTAIASVNANLGYIDIPVLLNIYFGDHSGFMVNAGAELSYLITDASTVESSSSVSINGGAPSNPSDPQTTNDVKFNKSDIALVGGVGYKFKKLLLIYLRASTGLGKVQEENSFIQSKNAGHNFTFEAGLALTFGGK